MKNPMIVRPASARRVSAKLPSSLGRPSALAGLALVLAGTANAQIFSGDPGLMSPPVDLPVLLDALCCIEWDFDGDGFADLLVGKDNSLHLLRNEGCSGVFTEVQDTLLPAPSAFNGFPDPGVFCGDVGDVNNDGFDDVVISTTIFPEANWIILGGTGGTLTTLPLGMTWPTLNDIELVDVTAAVASTTPPLFPLDGQLDLVACSSTTWDASGPGGTINYSNPGALLVAAGTGGPGALFVDRSPAAPASTTAPAPDTFYTSVATGDFDGDGRPDVVVTGSSFFDRFFANTLPAVTRVYTNVPNGAAMVDTTATAFAIGTAEQDHNQVVAIDYDDDGDLDLVTFNSEAVIPFNPQPATQITTYRSNLQVMLNNGPAAPIQFAAPTIITAVCTPSMGNPCPGGKFLVGDLTNDGRADVVHSAGVLVGTAGAAMVFDPAFFAPFPLGDFQLVGAIYDLDCNGRNDLVCSSNDNGTASGLVAYLDPQGRLDGSATAMSVQNQLLAIFTLLNPNALFGFLVIADAELVPGVPVPGFSGLGRLGGNVIIIDDGQGGPSLVPGGAVALPENTAAGGPFFNTTLFFQSFEFLPGGEIVLSNVVRTAF